MGSWVEGSVGFSERKMEGQGEKRVLPSESLLFLTPWPYADLPTPQHWRQMTLESKARRFRRETLLATALSHWRRKAKHVSDLTEDAYALVAQNEHRAKAVVFTIWRDKTVLLGLERRIEMTKREKTLRSCWEYWRWRM